MAARRSHLLVVTGRPYNAGMTDMRFGRFWAIGVGPGDPELLTLKALTTLRRTQVVYHAGPEPKEGRALTIIRSVLLSGQEVRSVLTQAMGTVSGPDWKTHYRPGVERIAEDCRRGLNVAYVAEGDPTLYSTASRVWELLAEVEPRVPVEIIPGISSVTAAAARVGWALARKDEMLAVVPASYHRAEFADLLERFPALCFLKVPQALPQLVDDIQRAGAQAVYVENLGTEQEWVSRDLSAVRDRKGYFALLLARRKQAGAQGCSVAEFAAEPIRVDGRGPAIGKVWVVGIGPGDPRLLTQQAVEALEGADLIVGYQAYLEALAPLGLRAELRGSPIGAEKERAAHALELAKAGRTVVVVSSGDAGIYGMAGLILETAETASEIPVEVVPGVTAAIAAASLLGAPLGHDFACISLSDLLTPWNVIEERLEAAGRGDFVVVLYNPLSSRRTWQLPRACEILLRHRAPATPVGIVDRAYRPGSRVRQTTLAELTPDGVGMETTLVIGSSRTRAANGRLVTPRGYLDEVKPRSARGTGDGGRAAPDADPGRRIMEASFAIIERELGPHTLPAWAFAVVRRMIHASADFEFAQTVRYSPDFAGAVAGGLGAGAAIVTDTEMVRLGIGSVAEAAGLTAVCHLHLAGAERVAASEGLTRSAAGIRAAARRYPAPILAVGNAPTALEEALRLIEEEGWRPAAVVGMPVGFVGVEEAKARLLSGSRVPYLTCVGRKGGSAVTAAAVNALVEFFSKTAEG